MRAKSLSFCVALLCCLTLPGSGLTAAAGWDAEKTTAPTGEGGYCPSLGALIQSKIAHVRVDKAALVESETGAPFSLMDMANRWAGKSEPNAWQIEKKRQIEREEAEVRELNLRYQNERCTPIDVEQLMALPQQPGDVPAPSYTSSKKKLKLK